jgi:hypothetical protein
VKRIVPRLGRGQAPDVSGLPLIAPVFLLFELWQLFMSERYLGIKQIARAGDPREMGPGEAVAFLWTSGILLYAAWAVALLAVHSARAEALGLIATTAVGYSVRRNCGLKWVLVTLSFEGAIRIGLVSTIAVEAWRHV